VLAQTAAGLVKAGAGLVKAGTGLGVLEQAIRAAVLAAGSHLLEGLLAGDKGYQGPRFDCGAGHQAVFVDYRTKEVDTVVGHLELERACYHCAQCEAGLAPRDDQLGVAGASLSPGLAQMASLAGSHLPFVPATSLVGELAGIELDVRRLERAAESAGELARQASAAETAAICARTLIPVRPPAPLPDKLYAGVDGTGVPVRPAETAGRAGKGEDGQARTREVKICRIFTQSGLDAKDRPAPGKGSSSYVHTLDGIETFTSQVRAEFIRRGGPHFRQAIFPGDGARWIQNLATAVYPQATQIVDLYHAREHLADLAGHLAFILDDEQAWLSERNDDLDNGDIDAIVTAALVCPLAGVKADDLDTKLGYFTRNAHRMRYKHFRDLDLFVGSGAIEASCKLIVGQRLKQSGMHWTVDGADSIMALRCQRASGRWDQLWPHLTTGTTSPASLRATT